MNVLIVNHRLDAGGGGTARKAVTLSRALHDAGCQVRLAAFSFGAAPEQDAHERTYYMPYVLRRWTVPAVWPGAVFEHVSWADVVLLVNHWTTINAVYALAAWRRGTPFVVMPCGALPIFGRSAWLKQAYNTVVGQRIVRRAHAGIAVTPLEADDFRSYGIPAHRVHVIPNAVDPNEAEAADPARFRRECNQNRPFVLYAGRLSAVKGPDLLLRAWQQMVATTPFDLVLAGASGDMTADVARWIAVHGQRARVRWVGQLRYEALLDAFSAAHALVVPSRSEAMSLVLLEAALAGCPVIATSACGVPAVAAHGGLEVAPDVDALSTALSEALRWSPGEARRRGDTLKRFVQSTYTWAAVTPRYMDVLCDASRGG